MDPPYSLANAERGSFLSSLIRLRVLGVTDAVGDEERESCGDVVPIAMREAGDAPSDAVMSRFISSLLRRDTEMVFALSIAGTLGREAGRLVEDVLSRCSCTGISP